MEATQLWYISAVYHYFRYNKKITNCSGYCKELQLFFPKAKVFGYFSQGNPLAQIGVIEGGHDFLVLEDRWILDFWHRCYNDEDFPLVVAIEDHAKWYGDINKWEQVNFQ